VSEALVDVKIEDISPVKKKLSFDVSWVEVKKEIDAVYRDVGRKSKIKGFRQGKVPRKVLESLYKDHVEGETVSNLVNKYYWDFIKEKGIHVVAQPEIDPKGIEEEKNFTFEATVEVEPVIEPKEYTGLELERQEKEVTESDIEARLQQIRQMFGTMEEVEEDREVKEGDFTAIDFEGRLDGKPVKEMTAEGYLLEIGSGMFVPGFESQVVGMKKGQLKQIQVKFPDDYRMKNIAGKDIEFAVTLKNIKERKLPEIDEKFIRNFDRYNSLEDLKKDISKTLEEENKAQSDSALKELIITKLFQKNEFEVPPSFIERQISFMIADIGNKMASRGLNPKQINGLSEQYKGIYQEEATKIVKTVLLMKSIAAKESITVDDGEINDRLQEMAKRRGLESVRVIPLVSSAVKTELRKKFDRKKSPN